MQGQASAPRSVSATPTFAGRLSALPGIGRNAPDLHTRMVQARHARIIVPQRSVASLDDPRRPNLVAVRCEPARVLHLTDPESGP